MALYPSTIASLTDLTAVGVTEAIQCSKDFELHTDTLTFQVTVSGIGTDVVVRFEGSLTGDNQSFFNLDGADADTTLTSDGTTGYSLSDLPVEFVRVRLVSFTGGSPTVATTVGAA
jgi:hypothetical protein